MAAWFGNEEILGGIDIHRVFGRDNEAAAIGTEECVGVGGIIFRSHQHGSFHHIDADGNVAIKHDDDFRDRRCVFPEMADGVPQGGISCSGIRRKF